ncbi:unnamed protein product [Phytomonas sp. Hart1]|nr:unnamed protein product [Phytomonas sp. Hart1]|eukprot:CCW66907.1 unnamed protein product [Phytomonas sp. isolate Hart1]
MPLLGRLTEFVHGVRREALPASFARIFDLAAGERAQFLPGYSRQSTVGERISLEQRVADGLTNIRFSLYQLYGSLCEWISMESLETMLDSIGSTTELPIHHIRVLSEKCLFLIGQQHPALLQRVLRILGMFFTHQARPLGERAASSSSNSAKPSGNPLEDDVVYHKQWLFYTKDVLTFIRTQVLEGVVWQSQPFLLTSTVELAAVILESGSNSIMSSRFLLSVVSVKGGEGEGEGVSLSFAPSAETATVLHEAQLMAYGRLVYYLLFLGSSTLAPREKETIAYMAAEAYISYYPKLERGLELARIPSDKVEELRTEMIFANGLNMKRRKVKEKFLAWASS